MRNTRSGKWKRQEKKKGWTIQTALYKAAEAIPSVTLIDPRASINQAGRAFIRRDKEEAVLSLDQLDEN